MVFQTQVNRYMAPGVKGGWAGSNPYTSLIQSNNGDMDAGAERIAIWQVGASGVIIGQFAFADTINGKVTSANPGTGTVMSKTASGTVRVGFVQRDQNALIPGYMGGSTVALLAGQPVTLMAAADLWAEFLAGAAVGQFVFASFADGAAIAGTTNTAPTTTASVTTATGSPNLTAVGAGVFAGQPISGTGVPAGAYVVSVNRTNNTAVLSANATATGTITATVTTAALTDFRVISPAAAGNIAKISVQG